MDNFKIIYRILKILEKALDYEDMDPELLSADALGITSERREALLKMLLDNGYIEGIVLIRAVGMQGIRLKRPRITLKGLEYLNENSLMKKAAAIAKGAAGILG